MRIAVGAEFEQTQVEVEELESGLYAAHYLVTTAECEAHRAHTPKAHRRVIHHIWPLGEGGANVASNRIVICDTGHYNVHMLLDLYKEYGGPPPLEILRHWNSAERELAWMGWNHKARGEV